MEGVSGFMAALGVGGARGYLGADDPDGAAREDGQTRLVGGWGCVFFLL
jgi:hypothetical protein